MKSSIANLVVLCNQPLLVLDYYQTNVSSAVVKIVFIDFKFEGSLLPIFESSEFLRDCMWSKRKELLL